MICRFKVWFFARKKALRRWIFGMFYCDCWASILRNTSLWPILIFFFFLILWTKVALFKKYNYQSHRFHIPSQRNSFWATVCWLFVLMLFRWHWADKAWLSNLDYLFTNNSLNINSVQNGLADFNYFLLSKVSRFVTKVVMLCL